jgi:protein-disulfide isomerase
MQVFKKLMAGAAVALSIFAGPAVAQTADAPAAAVEIVDFGLGPTDAKVKVIEYASFTCPHCARFHTTVFPKLKADYIDTGKIRFEYREVYFDRPGIWAGMIARCGGEMRYFGVVNMIYEKQGEWPKGEGALAVVENLKKLGRTVGMDDATMDACMKNDAKAKAMLAHYEANAKADDLKGTPTFFINGTKHSNMPYDEMKAIIDAELAK